MNATTKNLTLAALLALSATAHAEFGNIGRYNDYGTQQQQQPRSYGSDLPAAVPLYNQGSSSAFVYGGRNGPEMYLNNGPITQRIGGSEGPRTYIRSGNGIYMGE